MDHRTKLGRLADAAPASGIVAVFDRGRGLDGVIPLWAGEGDLATPPFIAKAAEASLAAGETFYTDQRGIPELRAALARYTAGLYGVPAQPEGFLVTGSGMQAIQIALAALTDPGDEIVYFGPAWPNLPAAAGIRGVRAVEVALDRAPAGWSLNAEKLREALTGRTRAIFVNSPANPTGWTASRETLAAILELSRERGLAIIADEIYARFFFARGRAPSFHDVMEPGDTVVFVNSMSKNWAMTGWRVGWIEAHPTLMPTLTNLVQYSTSGVATFMQRGAIAALEAGEAFVEMQVERADKARMLLQERLLSTGRVSMPAVEGAFYAYFFVEGLADTREAAFRIVEEARVGLAPGTAFGSVAPDGLRACFNRRLDEVEEAGDRLARWIGDL